MTDAPTSGTAVTASGTSIDFTGIPSTAKRITVMLSGVSTSGTSPVQIQLGTGTTPTYTTSGYLGSVTTSVGSSATSNISSGFTFNSTADTASFVRHGFLTITNVSSNIWAGNGILGLSNEARIIFLGGSISLAAALTAVRITTVNGTDTFDAGTINIMWE